MKILLIVPSYQRQHKIKDCVDAWKKTTTGNSEFLLVLEEKDDEYPDLGVKVMKGNYGSVGKALNEAFLKYPNYDYYAHINDDHILRTKGWEDKFIEAVKDGGFVYGNDLLQKEKLSTAVMMSGEIPRKLGYIALPSLTHLYVDRVWMETGKELKKIHYLDDVIIEHMHFTAGKSKQDEAYKRVNSDYGKWQKIYDDWMKTKPCVSRLKDRPTYQITGEKGFIGKALKFYLDNIGFVQVEGNCDYFLHFGSVSSNILFNDYSQYIGETIRDFIEVVEYCKKKHIKLIFPSSATVYDNLSNYSHTKMALEEIAQAYGVDYLALRIFAGYGMGERHKKDYASIVYQFCKSSVENKEIVIYGDGEQTRDFVYIDNIIVSIVNNLDKLGVIDIGTGVETSFNKVVEIIEEKIGKKLSVKYVDTPKGYLPSLKCKNPISSFIDINEGIEKILESL